MVVAMTAAVAESGLTRESLIKTVKEEKKGSP